MAYIRCLSNPESLYVFGSTSGYIEWYWIDHQGNSREVLSSPEDTIEFFKRLNEYLKHNKSVIIESTLSGTGLSRILTEYKSNGYAIHVVYVFMDEVELCKHRISARVKKGGHNVPEKKDIEQR